MAKLFRLNFERYHRAARQRPAGTGAFFDFVTDAARLCAPKPKSSTGRFGRQLPETEPGEGAQTEQTQPAQGNKPELEQL